MKQTAVEWLIEQISEKQPNGFYVIDTLEDVKKVFEQAKAMEKENIIDFGYRCIGEVDSELGDLIYKKIPEEIYNETFKSE